MMPVGLPVFFQMLVCRLLLVPVRLLAFRLRTQLGMSCLRARILYFMGILLGCDYVVFRICLSHGQVCGIRILQSFIIGIPPGLWGRELGCSPCCARLFFLMILARSGILYVPWVVIGIMLIGVIHDEFHGILFLRASVIGRCIGMSQSRNGRGNML